MARWSVPASTHADGFDRRARRQPGGQVRAVRDPGIGLDQAAAGGLELGDLVEIVRRMDAGQLLAAWPRGPARRTALGEPGPLELAQDRLEPLGPLGMTGRGGVVEHPPVGEQGDHRRLLDAVRSPLSPGPIPRRAL